MRKASGILGFALALAACAFQIPLPLEASFGWGPKLQVFAVVASLLVSMLALGERAGRRLLHLGAADSLLLAPALGSVMFAFAAFAFAHLGMLGPSLRWPWIMAAFSPLLFGLPSAAGFRWRGLSGPEKLAVAYVFLLLATKLTEGFKLQSIGDPFTYHLAGPRFWYQEGGARWSDELPVLFQTGPWDCLYLWAYQLLGGHGSEGLVAGQHAAQWLVAGLGSLGVPGAAAVLARKLTSSDRARVSFAVLILVSDSMFTAYTHTAKNDTGSLLWIFAGCALSMLAAERPRAAPGAGFLLGAGVAAKFTAGIFAAPWALTWVIFHRGRKKLAAGFLAAGSLALIPLALRNYLATGNPFYPSLNGIFRSEMLLPSWERYLSGFQAGNWNQTRFEALLTDLFTTTPPANRLVFPVMALAGLSLALKRNEASLPVFRFLPFLCLPLFGFVVGDSAELRLGAPITVMLSILVADELYSWAKRLAGARAAGIGAAALFAWSAATSRIPLYAFHQAPRYSPSHLALHELSGGPGKAAVREHVPGGETVFVDDGEFYYLFPRKISLLDSLFEGRCGLAPEAPAAQVAGCLGRERAGWLLIKSGSTYGLKVREAENGPHARWFQRVWEGDGTVLYRLTISD